ncbi:FeoB-associated Cys-rich membrane protein [uncultured Ruminococcus sp.]|uniref:FeoB-associated Cys-rich membrane protein n=1 Tax=uncultured Ruminococcus sp. TaxID=165186 RepID=UPI0025CF16C5|nr:FeoB-associated Cys-rich membrane protein [uncultured Ruminococcus sp.]
MAWLSGNIGTILVGLLVCGLVVLAVGKLVRDRRRGKSSCGCSCSQCPNSGICRREPPEKSNDL